MTTSPFSQISIQQGATAMTGPTTPGNRLPVVDKTKVDPETLKAAEGMEAMFLDYLMKTMRQTVPKSEMDLDSPATEVYRGMLDTETAQRAAHAGGVGLADQIIAYLESQRYTLGRAPGQGSEPKTTASAVQPGAVGAPGVQGTGGTYEGQSNRK